MIDGLIALWELEYDRASVDLADSYAEYVHENYGHDWDFGPDEVCPELYERCQHAEAVFHTLRKLRGLPKQQSFWF